MELRGRLDAARQELHRVLEEVNGELAYTQDLERSIERWIELSNRRLTWCFFWGGFGLIGWVLLFLFALLA